MVIKKVGKFRRVSKPRKVGKFTPIKLAGKPHGSQS